MTVGNIHIHVCIFKNTYPKLTLVPILCKSLHRQRVRELRQGRRGTTATAVDTGMCLFGLGLELLKLLGADIAVCVEFLKGVEGVRGEGAGTAAG